MLALLNYITINIDPVLLKVGSFSLRWYGLMYVLGIALGLVIVLPYARRRGLTSEQVWNIFWGVAIAALVGGRLYYVVQSDPSSFLHNPRNILAYWQGGMAFYGAIFLGVPVLLLLARQQRVELGVALDCVAIFAPLAQAVGRIGNLINGDIVGYQSNLPWATAYGNKNKFISPDLLNVPLQPAAAYELLFSVALFLVLWPLRFRLRPAGMLFVLYLSIYSVGQFILFIWRDNDFVWWDLKQAQITAVVVQLLLVALSYLILSRPWWFDAEYALADGEYGDDSEDEEEYEEEDAAGEAGYHQEAEAGESGDGTAQASLVSDVVSPSAGEHQPPQTPLP